MHEEGYEAGRSFDEFLEAVKVNRGLWDAVAKRARVAPAEVERCSAIPGTWKLLALADDWCGDAVNIVPVVARLAEAAPNLELRIVGREEIPGLMDRHQTNGSRSIPVVVLLDEAGQPRGWWGPRPSALQAWFEAEGRHLAKEERYRELRRWYARDRGAAIAREVVDLVWCGAKEGPTGYEGTRPCPELVAAT